jgi:DNA replication protein DnaC
MRSPAEVAEFLSARAADVGAERANYEAGMFAGHVPQLHWFVEAGQVKHNTAAFQRVIVPYRKRMNTAYKHGYGLLFLGDNGTGKTMFQSYLLGRAVVKGFSVFYSTLSQLDSDIKRGFDDKEHQRNHMNAIQRDFLAIDELGKEHFKAGSYLRTALEALLKQRYDEGFPTFLASNLDYSDLVELYGATIQSMWEGRYHHVRLDGGDFRRKANQKMRKDMGL